LLSPPPRNVVGQVEPHDHLEILPDDGVIRRVSEQHIVLDKDGQRRISSMAFSPSSPAQGGGLSVDLQRAIEESGRDAVQFVTTPRWIGSVRFTAQQLRNEGFLVGFDPLPPDNPFHGEVWGQFSPGKKKKTCPVGSVVCAHPRGDPVACIAVCLLGLGRFSNSLPVDESTPFKEVLFFLGLPTLPGTRHECAIKPGYSLPVPAAGLRSRPG